MTRFQLFQQHLRSLAITALIGVFVIVFIVVYNRDLGTQPTFFTQALDCNGGVLCDRDNICDATCETSTTCPADCHTCGNAVCEPTENNSNCSTDCPDTANCGNRYCES